MVCLGATNLGLFDVVGHAVTIALCQHAHQSVVQAHIAVIDLQSFGLRHGFGLVLPVDQVPSGQVKNTRLGTSRLSGPK